MFAALAWAVIFVEGIGLVSGHYIIKVFHPSGLVLCGLEVLLLCALLICSDSGMVVDFLFEFDDCVLQTKCFDYP